MATAVFWFAPASGAEIGARTAGSEVRTTHQALRADSVVSVDRPAGTVAITSAAVDRHGRVTVEVEDTRDDDPGWTVLVTIAGGERVRWTPTVIDSTPRFVDSDGTTYAQDVDAAPARWIDATDGAVDAPLASAPAHHGLGIAHVAAELHGADARRALAVTVTVV